MKTKENFFKGFPVVWNRSSSRLRHPAGEYVSFAVVVIAGIMTFLPVSFLHPVRVMCSCSSCGAGCIALFQAMDASPYVKIGIAAAGIYLFVIGAVMQIFPDLGKKKA